MKLIPHRAAGAAALLALAIPAVRDARPAPAQADEKAIQIVRRTLDAIEGGWALAAYDRASRVRAAINLRGSQPAVGVTANLVQRVSQHKEGLIGGFTRKYGCKTLVYFEVHEDMATAIAREKQIKAGSRSKKLTLIEGVNPDWRDLFEQITQ